MDRAPAQARSRGGFALVLALAVMSLLVLTILSLAGLLSVESRAADVAAQELRGRLNTVMAARLALAHLQQETGPDQRATATGELAGLPTSPFPSPYVAGTPAARQVGQGQARWTGVWRSDAPNQPPAWLISGKGAGLNPSVATTAYLAQARSLIGSSDYAADQWAPWQINYPTALSGEPMRVLVGDGSAGLDVGADKTAGTADDKDLRVALPMIPFPGATLGEVAGSFAYWIGDEGVKVRVNLPEPRDLSASAPNNLDAVDALRAPSRAGTQLLIGVGGVNGADGFVDLAAADRGSVSLLPGFVEIDAAVNLPTKRATFHDHSYWSAGVLADSYRGGLRRDLSLAFEMDDREFDISEYGNATGEPDGKGAATELYTTYLNFRTNDQLPRTSWFPRFDPLPDSGMTTVDPRPRVWTPIWDSNPDNPGRVITTSASAYKAWSPIFVRDDEMGQPLKDPLQPPNYNLAGPYNSPRRFNGPLWHLVRDYYRLYKELDWVAGGPRIDARAFFPNIDQLARGGYRPDPAVAPFAVFDLDNALWTNYGSPPGNEDSQGTSPDPLGVINAKKTARFIPRAVRGAYMPTLHRVALVLSFKRTPDPDGVNFRLKLFCTPVIALHNPYSVALRLRAPNAGSEPDPRSVGYAARMSFSGFYNLKVMTKTHVGNDPTKAMTDARGSRLDYLYGLRLTRNPSDPTKPNVDANVNDENFSALIPEVTIQPGETMVFTSRDQLSSTDIQNVAGNGLRLSPGFFFTGGFHADFHPTYALSSAGNPDHGTTPQTTKFSPNSVVETWFNAEGMYWRHWLYMSSFRKQSRGGDAIADMPLQEVLGTRKMNSRASHAQMINLGTFNSDSEFYFGDPGSQASPVPTLRISQMRDFATEANSPGSVVGVIETRIRVADTARDTSYDRMGFSVSSAQSSPVPAAHPTWIITNPLAQTSGSPGHIFAEMPGTPKPEISTSSGLPSVHTQFRGGDELGMNGISTTWSPLVATQMSADGSLGYGGNSHSAIGATAFTPVDIPRNPPLSIGQLMHANVSPWAWSPYYTVGNSFATPGVPRDKSWVHNINPSAVTASTGGTITPRNGGHTMPDMAYLMNHALWDSFFFSGAAPRLSASRSGSYPGVRSLTTQQVLNAFATGADLLGNTRMRLHRPVGRPAPATAFAAAGFHTPVGGQAPTGQRQIAAYLLNEGAFNVNSTSVEAWTGFLGSVRGIGLGTESAGTDQTRFPRVIGSASMEKAARSLRSTSYWSGFVQLSDTQLRTLAQSIVDEIKARTRFHQRTERDQEYPPTNPPGSSSPRRFRNFPSEIEPGTPFLGLTEFINRYLGPTKQPGAHIARSLYQIRSDGRETPNPSLDAAASKYFWTFGSGTLESAIGRADKALGSSQGLAARPTDGAPIVAEVSHNWGLGGRRTAMPIGYFFRNVEVPAPDATASYSSSSENSNRTHNGFGAPGCLFQGDLLQALGPGLATRSDTFTIRAAGNGATQAEGIARPSSAILELVVQRLPDYFDPRNAPETAISDPNLRAINRTLGRRFRVISARWLAPDQI